METMTQTSIRYVPEQDRYCLAWRTPIMPASSFWYFATREEAEQAQAQMTTPELPAYNPEDGAPCAQCGHGQELHVNGTEDCWWSPDATPATFCPCPQYQGREAAQRADEAAWLPMAGGSDDWTTFSRRTEDPKLAYLEFKLTEAGIHHRRHGESAHAPIVEIPAIHLERAEAILAQPFDESGQTVDDIADDDPTFDLSSEPAHDWLPGDPPPFQPAGWTACPACFGPRTPDDDDSSVPPFGCGTCHGIGYLPPMAGGAPSHYTDPAWLADEAWALQEERSAESAPPSRGAADMATEQQPAPIPHWHVTITATPGTYPSDEPVTWLCALASHARQVAAEERANPRTVRVDAPPEPCTDPTCRGYIHL